MASSFNLTAQINLRGPTNLKPIVSNIKKQLNGINSNLNLKIDSKASKSIDVINRKLQTLNNTLVQATRNGQALSAALSSVGSAAQGLNSLNKVNASVNKTANSITSTSKALQQASSEMENFGRQSFLAIKRFAAFSVATAGIYGLLNAINDGVRAFIEFDKQLIRLQQITKAGAVGIKDLENEITRLSVNLGISSESLTQVAVTLAQAGLSARDTKAALEALAKTELAPSFDNITDTTEGAIAAMRQFGISAGELEGALGSINAVAAAFAVESSDIISAIQRAGGVFAAASRGVSEGTDALNEFIAVFTSVRSTTRESAETIATGLRTIFTRIQRGSTIEFLREFGIELTDIEGKFVGPYEAIKRLSEGLRGLDPRDLRFAKIVEELGGFRQISKVIPLIQQFGDAQDALRIAQGGQGSLTDAQIKAQQSLANQLAKTRQEFLALIRSVGESQTFQAFFKIILGTTRALIKLASVFKPLLPFFAILGAIKGASAATKFGKGFIGAFGKGGGASAAGSTLGQTVTGSSGSSGSGGASGAIDTASIDALTTAVTTNTQSLNSVSSSLNAIVPVLNTLNTQSGTVAGEMVRLVAALNNYGGPGSSTLNKGGKVLKFARGGVVPGTGNSDTVPAMLQPGEFVIRKKAVETIGSNNLHKMNKYAKGGIAKATVSRVVDGDTLNVDVVPTSDQFNTSDTRLYGFDAYELNRGTEAERAKGQEAKKMAESYYPKGKDVTQLFNSKAVASGSDKYGRYLYSDDEFGKKLQDAGLAIGNYFGRGPRATQKVALGGYIQKFFDGGWVKRMQKIPKSQLAVDVENLEYWIDKIEKNPDATTGWSRTYKGTNTEEVDLQELIARRNAIIEFAQSISAKKAKSGLKGAEGYEPEELLDAVKLYQGGSGPLTRAMANNDLLFVDRDEQYDTEDVVSRLKAAAQYGAGRKKLYSGIGRGQFYEILRDVGIDQKDYDQNGISDETARQMVGKIIDFSTFLSTSYDRSVAEAFIGSPGGLMDISTAKSQIKGIDIDKAKATKDPGKRREGRELPGLSKIKQSKLLKYDDEKEFVLPPNTQFKIKKAVNQQIIGTNDQGEQFTLEDYDYFGIDPDEDGGTLELPFSGKSRRDRVIDLSVQMLKIGGEVGGATGIYDSDKIEGGTKVKKALLDQIKTSGKNYDVIHGPAGAGKTTLASKMYGDNFVLSPEDLAKYQQFVVLSGAGPTKSGEFSEDVISLMSGARNITALMPSEERVNQQRQKRVDEAILGNIRDTRSVSQLQGTFKAPSSVSKSLFERFKNVNFLEEYAVGGEVEKLAARFNLGKASRGWWKGKFRDQDILWDMANRRTAYNADDGSAIDISSLPASLKKTWDYQAQKELAEYREYKSMVRGATQTPKTQAEEEYGKVVESSVLSATQRIAEKKKQQEIEKLAARGGRFTGDYEPTRARQQSKIDRMTPEERKQYYDRKFNRYMAGSIVTDNLDDEISSQELLDLRDVLGSDVASIRGLLGGQRALDSIIAEVRKESSEAKPVTARKLLEKPFIKSDDSIPYRSKIKTLLNEAINKRTKRVFTDEEKANATKVGLVGMFPFDVDDTHYEDVAGRILQIRTKSLPSSKAEKILKMRQEIDEVLGRGTKDLYGRDPLELDDKTKEALGLGNLEGYMIEAILAKAGANPGKLDDRSVDYPTGLGQASDLFGIDPSIPTEVKRDVKGGLSKARTNFANFFKKYAIGGSVQDTVPALLTPGEFVINKKAASKIGYSQLNRLNKADKLQGYNKGGPVGFVQKLADGGDVVNSREYVNALREVAAQFRSSGSITRSLEEVALKYTRAGNYDIGDKLLGVRYSNDPSDRTRTLTGNNQQYADTFIDNFVIDAAQGFDVLASAIERNINVQELFANSAEAAGVSVQKFTKDVKAQILDKSLSNISSRQQSRSSLRNAFSRARLIDYSDSDKVERSRGELRSSLTGLIKDPAKIDAALNALVAGAQTGSVSLQDVALISSELADALDSSRDRSEALADATSSLEDELGGLTDAARATAEELDAFEYGKSGQAGKDFGLLGSLNPAAALRFKNSAAGGRALSAARNFKDLGIDGLSEQLSKLPGPIGKAVDAIGGLPGVLAATASIIGSELVPALGKLFGVSDSTTLAGIGGALEQGGQMAVSFGAIGQQLAGEIGGVIGTIAGALVGAIKGFVEAFERQQLTNSLAALARQTENVDKAFAMLAQNATDVTLKEARVQNQELVSNIQDLQSQGEVSNAARLSNGAALGGLAALIAGGLVLSGVGAPLGLGVLGTAALAGGLGFAGGVASADYTETDDEAYNASLEAASSYIEGLNKLAERKISLLSIKEIDDSISEYEDTIKDINERVKNGSLTPEQAKEETATLNARFGRENSTALQEAQRAALQRAGLFIGENQSVEDFVRNDTTGTARGIANQAQREAAIQLARAEIGRLYGQNTNAARRIERELGTEGLEARGYELAGVNEYQARAAQRLAILTREVSIETEKLYEAYDRVLAGITRFKDAIDELIKTSNQSVGFLTGQASIGPVDRTQENMLRNMSAYSVDELQPVIDSVVQASGGTPEAAALGEAIKANKIIEEQLPNILRTVEAGDVTEARNQITRALEGAGLSPETASALGDEVGRKLNERTGDRTGGAGFNEILQDFPAFQESLNSTQKAQEVGIAILEAQNDALDKVNEQANKFANLLKKSGDYLRQADNIRLEGALALQRTLGQIPTLEQLNEPFQTEIRSLSGIDSTDPVLIAQSIRDNNKRREQLEKDRQDATSRGDTQTATDITTELAQLSNASNNAYEALEKLASSGTEASNILSKIEEERQLGRNVIDFTRRISTQSGAEAVEMQRSFEAFNRTLDGSLNFGNVKERRLAYQGMDTILPLLRGSEVGRQAEADFTINMLRGQGINVDQEFGNTGSTLRDLILAGTTGTDANTKALIEKYNEAIAQQARAAEELAALNEEAAYLQVLPTIESILNDLNQRLPEIIAAALRETPDGEVRDPMEGVTPPISFEEAQRDGERRMQDARNQRKADSDRRAAAAAAPPPARGPAAAPGRGAAPAPAPGRAPAAAAGPAPAGAAADINLTIFDRLAAVLPQIDTQMLNVVTSLQTLNGGVLKLDASVSLLQNQLSKDTGFGLSVTKFGESNKLFGDHVGKFARGIESFGGYIDRLDKAVNTLSSANITMGGTFEVDVRVSGAAAFQAIEEKTQDLIDKEIGIAMEQMINDIQRATGFTLNLRR